MSVRQHRPEHGKPISASVEQIRALKRLNEALFRAGSARLEFVPGDDLEEHRVELPEAAFELLRRGLPYLLQGVPLHITPENEVLSTTEAARHLNISRQYLARLLDEGKIPSHRAGTHRRIYFDDLMAYKRIRDAGREKKLVELMRLGEDLEPTG